MPGSRPLPAARSVAALGVVFGLTLAGIWWARRAPGPRPDAAPVGSPAKYVDNGLCLGCHQQEAGEWEGSHHAQAMAPATSKSVRGDFGNRSVTNRGVTSRFFREGDRFLVSTEGPDGKTADFEIRYTFGVEPLQQYLIQLPGGRLQPLGLAWDGPRKRWFDLLPNERTPPGDVLHWTGRYQTANTMCLVCHVTRFEKGYDPATDTFASRWAEPNVSCQACHGPGDRHVQYETSLRGAGTPLATAPKEPHGLTVDTRNADARRRTELCAPCHSRRSELIASPAPGQAMLDAYLPSLLVQGLYHADGQQLEEVYVDASFRQSRMFQKGVTCTNCHNPHTGKLRRAGNAVCVQCHRPDPNPSFPTAVGNFDSPAHHFHKEGSKGASCVSCHMPSTTYMGIQARPDHSIRVPRPDVSAKIGTPDACTNCHQGKKAQWAADAAARWYGPVRKQGTHYGEAFAAARSGQPFGREAVAELIDNPLIPVVVRATALVELSQDPVTGADKRLQATRDPDPELRAAAAESVAGLSAEKRVRFLGPLLSDPVRAVRIAAARNLSSLQEGQLDPGLKPALSAALDEYIKAQEVALDMPGAQFNLAVVYENTGRRDLAERHYLGALRIDPDFTAARANLAQLYASSSRNADAEKVLAEGLQRRPEQGELQYSLGLLLAEEKRMKEATQALSRAAKLLPNRADVQYNYGLALEQAGQSDQAEASLLRAQTLDPDDPQTAYALAVFYAQRGKKAQALEWANRLSILRPNDPQVERLIASIRAGR
ncbi:MAG: ammonia-forming cytochrome c nitrite reductase subunit c552 [Vicinamibacteria bacterium]|nr:ammonia-forming cytochrome c nitrite reductase subunit c552 [Vicinamibacteria bacterium]